MSGNIGISIDDGESDAVGFFEQWGVYKKIMDNNYMFHNEIADILNQHFTSYFKRPFSILDLGCGDSYTASRSLSGSKLESYTGVDLSRTALGFARSNLESFNVIKKFIAHDFFKILYEIEQKYDVIQAGYSMHHLDTESKRIMIGKCHEILNNPGLLLIYDVCRKPNESRDEYFGEYCGNCEENWTGLDKKGIKLLIDHICSFDYPETIDTHFRYVQEAGFIKPEVLFTDKHNHHFLMACYT